MKLVRYDAARHALQAANSVDEVKSIRDKAQAMAAYARQAKDTELVEWATEIKVRAERRAGEMLAAMELRPGRPTSNTDTLSALGIQQHQSSRWQKLAAISEDKFELAVAAAKEVAGEVTTAAMLRLGAGGVRTQTSGEDEWYTPAEHIDLARKVLGSIDLDPASNKFAQRIVKAGTYFTAEDDGLAQEWCGAVWLNPPYSRGLMDKFIAKLRAEIDAKRTTAAVLLTHNFTDTAWFRAAWDLSKAVCFTYGRIKFYNEAGQGDSPTSGHVFMYYGRDVRRFLDVFRPVGNITARSS